MTESKICTCPSGDGSLRWPCLAHPAVEQAGGDERVIGWRERILAAHPNSDPGFWPDALLVEHMAAEIADLRAALAQPSLVPPDRGPWHAVKWDGGRRVDLSSDDFEHDVALTVSGDFVEGDKFRYAQELAAWMNAHLAQPSPAQAEQADGEAFDLDITTLAFRGRDYLDKDAVITKHAASVARWADLFNRVQQERDAANSRLHEVATACATAEQERDTALAEANRLIGVCASLDSEKREMEHKWDAIIAMRDAALARVAELAQALRHLLHNIKASGKRIDLGLAKECAEDALARIDSATPAQAQHSVPRAWLDVQAERRRQVEAEGWTPEHDDEHACDEIAAFACFYAMPPAARDWDASSTGYGDTLGEAILPEGWEPKTGDRRRDLVKAGGLILAEIERLDRAAAPGKEG